MTTSLALSGAHPSVPSDLARFHHPDLSTMDLASLVSPAMRHRTISFDGQGLVKELEDAFESLTNVPHSLATNSGTSALYAAFAALGLGPGDDVLVPAYTFFATATPLLRLGCRPILVDCLEDGNISPDQIDRRCTPATRAVVITHMWGVPCRMDEILAVTRARGLQLIEDASHAHGATYGGQVVGSFGDAGCWSLGAAKILTGGQGGILQSRDPDLVERARLLTRANDKFRDRAIADERYSPYAVTGLGHNLRIHPMSAAVVTGQLVTLSEQLRQRREIAALVSDGLADIDGLDLVDCPVDSEPAWYAIPLLYTPELMQGVNRDEFVDALHAEGAEAADVPGSTRPLSDFLAFNAQQPTFDLAPDAVEQNAIQFCNADRFQQRVIKLPGWYGDVGLKAAESYISAIRKVGAHLDEVRSHRTRSH